LVHGRDVVPDSDCLTKLPVELLLLKLFEVVVVEDLDHLTAEALPLGGHSALKDFTNCIRLTSFEDDSRHNVASIRLLIVKDILVGSVQPVQTEGYPDAKVDQVIENDEGDYAVQRAHGQAEEYHNADLEHEVNDI
jgi:hypothetical protein